jgi:hypothetical protein
MKPSLTNPRMPAEWEPHASTWLAWPHYRADWPGKFEPIPWVYAEIIRHLGRHERVDLIVNSAASQKQARKVLSKANALSENVHFHKWPTNRVWTRDSGCTFVVETAIPHLPSQAKQGRSRANDPSRPRDLLFDPNLSAVTWRFNAWAKYSDYQHDEKIGSLMAAPLTPDRGLCWKVAPSKSTDAAHCSPPKNACSAKHSNVILACPATTTPSCSQNIWELKT